MLNTSSGSSMNMPDQEVRKGLLKKKLSHKEIKEEDVKLKLQVSDHMMSG